MLMKKESRGGFYDGRESPEIFNFSFDETKEYFF